MMPIIICSMLSSQIISIQGLRVDGEECVCVGGGGGGGGRRGEERESVEI